MIEEPAPERTTYRDATIRMVARNKRRIGLSDIPVLYRREGKRGQQTITTGPKGIVSVVTQPGVYVVSVPVGCTERREIRRGRRGDRIGVVEGRTHELNLAVEARRRFMGNSPVIGSSDAPWPRNQTITVTFLLHDRCRDRPAASTDFSDLRWRTSDNLEVVDPGTRRSGSDARASVKVRCRAAGDASLWLVDRDDPRDRLDLLAQQPASPFDPDAEWCG